MHFKANRNVSEHGISGLSYRPGPVSTGHGKNRAYGVGGVINGTGRSRSDAGLSAASSKRPAVSQHERRVQYHR